MKFQQIHSSFFLSLLLLCACTGTPQSNPSEAVGDNGSNDTENSEEIAVDLPLKNIELDCDFTQINNISDLDIEWHEGPCSVAFAGTEQQYASFKFETDQAGLTINQEQPFTPQPKPRLIVSSPTLHILANYMGAKFRINGTLHTESLEIGNTENGTIVADTLDADYFKYQARGESYATFALIRSADALILADGTGRTDLNLQVGTLNLQAWGTQTITLTGHADHKDINSSRTNMVNDLLE